MAARDIRFMAHDMRNLVRHVADTMSDELENVGQAIWEHFRAPGITPVVTGFLRSRWRVYNRIIGYEHTLRVANDCWYLPLPKRNRYWRRPVELSYVPRIQAMMEKVYARTRNWRRL